MLTFTSLKRKKEEATFGKRVANTIMVKKELMYHTNFQTKEELFKGATEYLVSKGYATAEFEAALIQREERFPTGLPTNPPSAIPHSDGTYANEDVILCILNETPLEFYEMGSNKEKTIQAKTIFILMVRDIVTHLDQLQYIIEKTKNTNIIHRLEESDEPTAVTLVQEEL